MGTKERVVIKLSGRVFGDDAAETSENFPDGLMELFFAGVPAENLCKDRSQLFVNVNHCLCIPI